ncbi:uncharacterized protein K444DRAFT_615826 [Hyaloscypha bicolor E]|uniref:Uncharacterized protein n=1 Tax=Hyaloscypha bicolor E TaxID=1095630 RepID=A0A2J6T2W7_9HELO|nr:uncharacterized protein K444DRAFT_615826 [Hyaloscypha bicolor E]PMD57368.1 hypothetical protein K444DRAFT_615826 [Hyaloscypha bicolor E]
MYLIPRDTAALAEFAKRQIYYGSRCNYYGNCRSSWYRWGRWVLAGILIFIGLIILAFILFCGSRRRRRNRHAVPMTSQAPLGGFNSGYGNEQQYGAPLGPPPQYGSNTGADYDGYYGQQSGVAQPQNAYKP